MKNLRHVTLPLGILLFIALIMGASTDRSTQTNLPSEVSEFLIVVNTSDDGIKLVSKKGTAWKELSFDNWKFDHIFTVDQLGMVKSPRNQDIKSPELANFLFTIQRTENGVSLEGIEGTAWKTLSFSCPKSKCNQAIDQLGMTTLD